MRWPSCYLGRGSRGLPARAIISRVCAAWRSAGNGRSVKQGRSSVYIAEKAIFKGLCFSLTPSTRSKGWRLSWFFFRRRKKNSSPANCRTSSNERRMTPRPDAVHPNSRKGKAILIFFFRQRKKKIKTTLPAGRYPAGEPFPRKIRPPARLACRGPGYRSARRPRPACQ